MLHQSKTNAAGLKPHKLFVRSLSLEKTTGFIDLGYRRIPCALGRSGRHALKREGDGATPIGRFQVLELFFRPDRYFGRKAMPIPTSVLRPNDGWCDAPCDRNYNRPVARPYSASSESLWRKDHLYDVIGVLDYNITPRIAGRGSAIFLHIAQPDFSATDGCIAVAQKDMLHVLRCLRPTTRLVTTPAGV